MAANNSSKIAPRDWEPFFRKANVRVKELEDCKSRHAKAVKIGRFLSPNVDREVEIDVKGRTGKAVLRVVEGRAKEKAYFFEVTWDDGGTVTAAGAIIDSSEEEHGEEVAPKKTSKRAVNKTKTAVSTEPGPKVKTTKTMTEPSKSDATGNGNDEDWWPS